MGAGDFCVFLTFLGIFHLCFQAQVLNSLNTTCNSNDLRALNGFLKGLDSSITGWGNANSSDCCSWDGVECGLLSGGFERRVVELNLGKRRLKGVVSESLAGLDQLRVLNVSVNCLRGALPMGLFQLQRLEVLDLSFNDLNDSIPEEINLPSIRIFNISDNSFTGTQPRLVGSVNLSHFIIGYNSFSGPIDAGICNISRGVQTLRFSSNLFSGTMPAGLVNCSSVQELSLDSNNLTGNLPDDLFGLASLSRLCLQDNSLSGRVSNRIGNLSRLTHLDISINRFFGIIPDAFGNLGGLQHLSAHSNNFTGQFPASFSNLSVLQSLNLRNNSIEGEIDLNCKAMTRLSLIDLGSNRLHGRYLSNLSFCKELRTINLARNNLDVEIPESFRSLQALTYLSLTRTGLRNISAALSILQHCKRLTELVLTSNFYGENMPPIGIQEFSNMKVFVLPNCGLTGSIPAWLWRFRRLQLLDLSWNRLSGTIPPQIGSFSSSLFYLDLSNNSFTGEIPESLTQMPSLISRNISLEDPPNDIPFFLRHNPKEKGLQYNKVTSFRPTLDLNDNELTGMIPPGFGKLKKLHVLDLSRNNLTGNIPEELSGMSCIEVLDLSFNNLSGSIPMSLTNLSFLSRFSVAHNQLYGLIPSQGQFSTFPNSSFEGNRGLCGVHFHPCQDHTPSISRRKQHKQRRSKKDIIGMALGIGSGTSLLLALVYFFMSRNHVQRHNDIEGEMTSTEKELESSGSALVLLFQNKDTKEVTIDDLVKSTNNFDQANIIGCGGFGLVYKAAFPDGRKVAIKRMSGDNGLMEREFQAEVETLSRAQHKNLVLLQGYCRCRSDRLLIYSYMENGSLDYWLHEKIDGGSALDWNTRLQIARGAARALAYLHQSCHPHILHRDIKSSNILLDENFEAHLADFGLARLILPCDTHVTTDLVGTIGYIPPEYGQASIATLKGDVYSFGAVLLELLTGKRPMYMCQHIGWRGLISWVHQMKQDKREKEVFDPFIYDKEHDKQMMEVLEIASLCLSECPRLRPFIQQIVLWLDSVGVDVQESDVK